MEKLKKRNCQFGAFVVSVKLKMLRVGGYVAVGVEEINGIAVRPVKGIPEYMLDEIQKETKL